MNNLKKKSKKSVCKQLKIFIKLGHTFVVDEKYEFIKLIGIGAYGVVCAATNKKNDSKVAIKKVKSIFLYISINI